MAGQDPKQAQAQNKPKEGGRSSLDLLKRQAQSKRLPPLTEAF